ncbi:creatininase family protein [Methylopila musalis]|uniref:Creatininase family protein n=1 Tax=Methylopila musalis TaxID=1134781 RepID=A0ABW3ZBI2_9HYPH
MSLPRRRWDEMTTDDFAGADRSSWVAVLPLAAVEQHGPHLPLGTDAIIGQGYLDRALALTPAELPVTVLPAQAIGVSPEHLGFPGTLTLPPETAIAAWTEIGRSVARAGLRRLVVVNSHGGNGPAMDAATRALRIEFGLLAAFTSWHRLGYPDGLFAADELRHGVHGGEVETSLMLALAPDLVRMDKARDFTPATRAMEREFAQLRASTPAGFGWMAQDLHPSGAVGNAAAATAAKGEAALAHGAAAFAALLADVARFPLERLVAGPLGD